MGGGGQTLLGQKPSASLKQSCLFYHGFRKPLLTGAPTSHLHPKGLHPGGHLSPNSAQAENSQGLPAQLCSHKLQPSRQRSQSQQQPARAPSPTGQARPDTHLLPLPLAVLHGSRRLGNLPARTNTGSAGPRWPLPARDGGVTGGVWPLPLPGMPWRTGKERGRGRARQGLTWSLGGGSDSTPASGVST